MYSRLPSLVLALSLGCTSCWFQKPPPRVFIPPPAKARPSIPRHQPELPDPGIELKITAELPPLPVAEIPALPPPPAPKRVAPAPIPRPVPVMPPQPPTEVPPLPPQIGRIFTDDQLRDYKRNLDESLDRSRKALLTVGGKRMNPKQQEDVRRVQIFQKQAELAREQDLIAAVELAKRADLLAQELLRQLP